MVNFLYQFTEKNWLATPIPSRDCNEKAQRSKSRHILTVESSFDVTNNPVVWIYGLKNDLTRVFHIAMNHRSK